MTLSLYLAEKIREVNEKYNKVIEKAAADDRFRFVTKDGEIVGFFTWREIWKNGQLHIYIQNMNIDPSYRGSFFFLRKFFREKYDKKYRFVYWKNGKKNKFTYVR